MSPVIPVHPISLNGWSHFNLHDYFSLLAFTNLLHAEVLGFQEGHRLQLGIGQNSGQVKVEWANWHYKPSLLPLFRSLLSLLISLSVFVSPLLPTGTTKTHTCHPHRVLHRKWQTHAVLTHNVGSMFWFFCCFILIQIMTVVDSHTYLACFCLCCSVSPSHFFICIATLSPVPPRAPCFFSPPLPLASIYPHQHTHTPSSSTFSSSSPSNYLSSVSSKIKASSRRGI